MGGDHQHCAKHPDRNAYAEVGEFRLPVCKECFEEMTTGRRIAFEARSGGGVGWGGPD